jgi:hypothetical protein
MSQVAQVATPRMAMEAQERIAIRRACLATARSSRKTNIAPTVRTISGRK